MVKSRNTETELLEFKFKPDNAKDAVLDENGYILKEEKEHKHNLYKDFQKYHHNLIR